MNKQETEKHLISIASGDPTAMASSTELRISGPSFKELGSVVGANIQIKAKSNKLILEVVQDDAD